MTIISKEVNFIPFESFKVGQKQNFGAYKVTKNEIIEFAKKYDPQFFHLDEEMHIWDYDGLLYGRKN